jgi:hypothetical protein
MNVIPINNELLDAEWTELIMTAHSMGMEIEEIKQFLHSKEPKIYEKVTPSAYLRRDSLVRVAAAT